MLVQWGFFNNNPGSSAYNTSSADRYMAEAHHPESFEQIVEWAYRTLPQTIRDLPDFPGIQVADEPPEDILKRKNWPQGRELLGCYSGIHRTVRQHNQISLAPDLIIRFSWSNPAVFKRKFAGRSERSSLARGCALAGP